MGKKKPRYINLSYVFFKCLGIADVSKLGMHLILHIKGCTNMMESKGYKTSIEYNADRINKEVFNSGPSSNQAKRGLEHLLSKNIVFYNPHTRKIRINYNPEDWHLTDKQYEKIVEIVNDEKLYFEIE